jgi:hypothetical protein
MGRGTDFGIRGIRGLFDLDINSGAVPIPRGDGDIPGEDFIQAKNIELELAVEGPKQSVTLADRIKEVRLAFKRAEEPAPLYFRAPGSTEQFIRVRPIGRAIQEDVQSEHGLKPITLRLRASDPRLYSTTSKTRNMGLYQIDTGGTDAPLNFPLNFEVASTTTTEVLHNAGDAKSYPVLRFYGPTDGGTVTGVKIINETTGQEFESTADILSGQVLKADMLAYVRADGKQVIGVDGASRYGDWVLPREPFYLQPGDNILKYQITGTSSESVANVTWFDTSL